MRFEIRAGGAFLIFISLVVLSGAVFALGLVAGYEMAQKNQPDLSQTSTTYPLPNAPAEESKPPPVAEMSPPAGAPAPASSPVAASAAAPSPSHPSVAAVKPAAPAIAPKPIAPNPAPAEEEAGRESPPVPAVAAPAVERRPYNIQIQAVMDRIAADEMVSRLRALGYNAQEMTTTLNGQTMYRVQVGPYRSSDEAEAAQKKLHEDMGAHWRQTE